MIAQRTAEGIAILSGIGGFLTCLVFALLVGLVGRMVSSPRRSKTTVIKGMAPSVPPPATAIDKPPPAPVQQPTSSQPSIRVLRTIQPALDWEERGDRVVGSYRTASAEYAGYILNPKSADREFSIVDPPQTLKDHAHGRVLSHRGRGRYLVRFAVAPGSAAAGVRAIERMLAEAEGADQRRVLPVVRPVQRARTVIRPAFRPYWELKHWEVQGDQLVGRYQTPHGSAEGYVRQHRSRNPRFFIVNPPQQLRSHPHWRCFHSIGSNRFAIHFHPAPPNPDAGMLAVEKVLAEALRPRRRST